MISINIIYWTLSIVNDIIYIKRKTKIILKGIFKMSQILEITMLICFGLSWPMSVIKNIKARTAKTMSLSFTLLIIGGYIAGITAKILSNQINFVLIAYLLNLAIVSMNVVVYFINRRYDKLA